MPQAAVRNQNIDIIKEDWFYVRDAVRHSRFSYRAIKRMYLDGRHGIRLEVCMAPTGRLITSGQAIERYTRAINDAESRQRDELER